MKRFLFELQRIEHELSAEKGRFSLFALFHPEGTPHGWWHLVVSAPWATDWVETVRLIASKLPSGLPPAESVTISRVIHVRPDNPGLDEVWDAVEVEHGLVELDNRTFFGVDVERALFITCRREPVPQPV